MIFCPECGSPIADGAFTCPECGYPVSNNIVTPSQTPAGGVISVTHCPSCAAPIGTLPYCEWCGTKLPVTQPTVAMQQGNNIKTASVAAAAGIGAFLGSLLD